jgi:hypothetical protein
LSAALPRSCTAEQSHRTTWHPALRRQRVRELRISLERRDDELDAFGLERVDQLRTMSHGIQPCTLVSAEKSLGVSRSGAGSAVFDGRGTITQSLAWPDWGRNSEWLG